MSLCSSPPHLLGLFDSPLSRGFGSRGHQVVTITRRTRDEGRSCHWAGRARMKDDDMGAGCHQGGTLALRGTPEWEATSVFFGPYFLFFLIPCAHICHGFSSMGGVNGRCIPRNACEGFSSLMGWGELVRGTFMFVIPNLRTEQAWSWG